MGRQSLGGLLIVGLALFCLFGSVVVSVSATSNGSASQERVYFGSIEFVNNGSDVRITIGVAWVSVNVHSFIIRDTAGDVIFILDAEQVAIPQYSYKVLTLALPDSLVEGAPYTGTLVTSSGGSFVSSAVIYSINGTAEYDPSKDSEFLASLNQKPPAAPVLVINPAFPLALLAIPITILCVAGAWKLAICAVGPKNRRERFVLMFFVAVIIVALALWVFSAFWLPSLQTM